MTGLLDVLSLRVLRLLSDLTIIGTSEGRVLVVGNFGLTSLLRESTGLTEVTLFDEFLIVGQLVNSNFARLISARRGEVSERIAHLSLDDLGLGLDLVSESRTVVVVRSQSSFSCFPKHLSTKVSSRCFPAS